MRALYTIEADISAQQEKENKLKKEKENYNYISISTGIGEGVKTLIYGIIASLVTIVPLAFYFDDANKYISFIIFFAIVSALLFLRSLIALVEYSKKMLSYSAATIFTFLSAILVMISTLNMLFGFKTESVSLKLFSIIKERIITFFEFPISSITKIFLYVNIVFLIPIALLFLASVIKLIIEKNKIVKCKTKINELNNEIENCSSFIASLNEELNKTREEAQQIYNKEIKEAQPDMEQMEYLAELGFPDAKKFLKCTWEKKYNEEIKKDCPNMEVIKKAARFGCSKACMDYAEPIFLKSVIPYDNDFHLSKNVIDLCLELQPYFKTASSARNPYGKLYYLYTKEAVGRGSYYTLDIPYKELSKLEDDFEELIRNGSLNDEANKLAKECLERIKYTATLERQRRKRAELDKYSGYYSDLKPSGSSNVKTEVEIVYVPDVSNM